MRSRLLVSALFWACWVQCWFCMPDTLSVSRAYAYVTKFKWPMEALTLMFVEKQIPRVAYTDEQATRFLVNGISYLEQTTGMDQVFGILAGRGDPVTRAFVVGIDNHLGPLSRTRWRWLPLIEGFDAQREPIYLTSVWSDGTRLKSMDVLRLDFFYTPSMQFFLPTAIVRPIQSGVGFGRGLEFRKVYEYPTSFVHYMRQPTLNSAAQLHSVIRRDFGDWLSLVSRGRRDSVEPYYQLLSPDWIHENLRRAFAKKRRNTYVKETIDISDDDSDMPLTAHQREEARVPGAADHTEASDPIPAVPYRNWDGRPFAYADTHAGAPSDARAVEVYGYKHLQLHAPGSMGPPETILLQKAGSSAQLPSTELRLGRSEPEPNVYAPIPLRFTPAYPVGPSWARLDDLQATSSGQSSSSRAVLSDGRSGFARWRRPDQSTSEQSQQP